MAQMRIDKISYRYGRGTPFEIAALRDVSFEIGEGELIGVIGHTGSGKSTLMQMLNALLKPDSGTVYLNGADIHKDKTSVYRARFQVGLCFQYPEYQLFGETCAEDIAFGPRNMGLPEEEVKARTERAADFVRLDRALLQRSPFDLSGGQKRRCAVAGVLAMQPEILILDEPTAGLDPAGRDAMISLIRAYRQNTGATVIFVTHSMEIAAAVSERILVMDHGTLALDGTPAEVFSQAELLEKCGLAPPFSARVLSALRARGYDAPDAFAPEETADALCALLRAEEKQTVC